ncbi:MAG TPA: hypothetical protein VG713_20620 [Pirellulales bacterium]|nr:hypothetical protein [Pirellulales bacterium]
MLRRLIFTLLVAAMVAVPMIALVLAGFGYCLAAMGDALGGRVCWRLAQAAGILWALDLVLLVVAMALATWSSAENRSPYENRTSEEPPLE